MNQERKFGRIYRGLRKELEEHHIHIVNEKGLSDGHAEFVTDFFQNEVRGSLVPLILDKSLDVTKLKDNAIYLAVKLSSKKKGDRYSIIEIPTLVMSRFVVLPSEGKNRYVMLIDDVIRFNLDFIYRIFDYDKVSAHTFKITRDAELDIDDDLTESWIDKLSKSLKNRKIGNPVRFVYDKKMPEDLLDFLLKRLDIRDMENITPGERYHNFKDFMDFPEVGAKHLRNKKLPPNEHPDLRKVQSVLDTVRKKDIMLTYPYQSFTHVIDLLREAAIDPKVSRIWINLYRVAKRSKVINALINAARNGKEVVVVLELTARFDEKNNIRWSNKLAEEGVRIIHGVPGLKVHSKLILIEQYLKKTTPTYIAHIGTGNFHEGTAKLYGDQSLLTADPRITQEVVKIFEFFDANYKRHLFRHLVVSPFNVRRRFNLLISNEIRNAKKGKKAEIILKLNNLVDETLIRRLYEASEAGVKVKLMIRGICSLIPGIRGMSENIEAYSVVDRFLEHSRIMVFHNGGERVYLMGSADWMTRNLDKRIEIITPIYDKDIQAEISKVMDIHFRDNVKARVLDQQLSNNYVEKKGAAHRSQIELYQYFSSLVK